MWRREKSLARWLGKWDPRNAPIKAETESRGRHGFRLRLPECRVLETPLAVECAVAKAEGIGMPEACVFDGLGGLSSNGHAVNAPARREQAAIPIADPARDFMSDTRDPEIVAVSLMEAETPVRTMDLPEARRVRAQTAGMIGVPNVRWLSFQKLQSRLRSFNGVQIPLPKAWNGADGLFGECAVMQLDAFTEDMPFMLHSLDLERLEESERRSFQEEALALKQIPVEGSELLAVFRHVPIEMISRLHYVADKGMIIYRISPSVKRTQTRVHDMAAVRDPESREIHLVPHRTRYQTVSLLPPDFHQGKSRRW